MMIINSHMKQNVYANIRIRSKNAFKRKNKYVFESFMNYTRLIRVDTLPFCDFSLAKLGDSLIVYSFIFTVIPSKFKTSKCITLHLATLKYRFEE